MLYPRDLLLFVPMQMQQQPRFGACKDQQDPGDRPAPQVFNCHRQAALYSTCRYLQELASQLVALLYTENTCIRYCPMYKKTVKLHVQCSRPAYGCYLSPGPEPEPTTGHRYEARDNCGLVGVRFRLFPRTAFQFVSVKIILVKIVQINVNT